MLFISEISKFFSMFTLAVVIYAVVMILINVIMSSRRGWLMAALRVGMTIVSAIIAVPITKRLVGALADVAYDILVPMLGSDISDALTDIPAGADGLRVLAALLAAPILYLVVFLVIRFIMGIVGLAVARILPFLRHPSLRAAGLPLGALNGLLVVIVTMIPLCGFLAMGGRIIDHFVDTAEKYQSTTIDDALDEMDVTKSDLSRLSREIEVHPVVLIVNAFAGNRVFDELTVANLDSTQTHGKTVQMDLEEGIDGLISAGVAGVTAFESFDNEDYTSADKQLLYDTADRVLESEWVSMLATDTIVTVSTRWKNNEEFIGMARPSINATIDPTFNKVLDILSKETSETIEEDLHTIMDVVGDFLVADLLSEDSLDPAAMAQSIQASGLLNTTLAKLETNPRLCPLVGELRTLSVRLVTEMLGVDELKNGKYADEMNMVADELNNALNMPEAERHTAVQNALNTAFKDYGIEVPKDVAMQMTDHMFDELGKDGKIESDELTDYFVKHADEGFDLVPDDIPDDLPDDLPTDQIPGDIPDEIPGDLIP